MNTMVKVARFHLVDKINYVLLVGIPALSFLVNAVVAAVIPEEANPEGHMTGGLVALPVYMVVMGIVLITKSLPFGFAVGLSRRTYYLGTLFTIALVSAACSLGVVVLQGVESLTGGWGLNMHFFEVRWILDGPWYATFLTMFVVLMLFFAYGMWNGLVYMRFKMLGMFLYLSAQVVVVLGAMLLVTWAQAWMSVWHFFGSLTAVGLTGILAALTAALAVGGFTTMRRITV